MPRRGRPRKNNSLFSFKDLVEYTSDSESDVYNIQHNAQYEVLIPESPERPRSPLRRRQDSPSPVRQGQQVDEHQGQDDLEVHHEPQVQDAEPEERHRVQPDQEIPGDVNEPMEMEVAELEERHQVQERVEVDNDFDENSSEDEDFNFDMEDYDSIYEKIKSKWLNTEIHHCVSKSASEAFWNIGLQLFPKLHSAEGRRKKTPQFQSIRNNMYNNLIPPVELEIGYRNKASGEITVIKDSITPLKRFPPDKYEKLYEIGTVKVNVYPTRFFQILP